MNGPTGAHQARKRFGQHFLHDPHVIARIIAAVAPLPDEHLVEIGPGLGAITVPLLRACGQLSAVELDRDVIPHLRAATAGLGTLDILEADALTVDFSALRHDQRPLRLVGNLPYNISTPLLFHFLEAAAHIRDMHFMLQKEVVERMAAGPGEADYGRLSVMLQARLKVVPLFEIGPGAFRPPPKVDSAIVRLVPLPEPRVPAALQAAFAEVVRLAFAQRRKQLRNTLKTVLAADAIEAAGVDPAARAETLDLAAYVRLAEAIPPR